MVNPIHLNLQYFSKVGKNSSTEKETENYGNLGPCLDNGGQKNSVSSVLILMRVLRN